LNTVYIHVCKVIALVLTWTKCCDYVVTVAVASDPMADKSTWSDRFCRCSLQHKLLYRAIRAKTLCSLYCVTYVLLQICVYETKTQSSRHPGDTFCDRSFVYGTVTTSSVTAMTKLRHEHSIDRTVVRYCAGTRC